MNNGDPEAVAAVIWMGTIYGLVFGTLSAAIVCDIAPIPARVLSVIAFLCIGIAAVGQDIWIETIMNKIAVGE